MTNVKTPTPTPTSKPPTSQTVAIPKQPLSLKQKIVRVRKEIGGFEKDSSADKYKYVSGSQVLGKILSSMNNLGLMLVPNMVHGSEHWERHEYTRKYKSGGEATVSDFIVQCQMVMTWLDADSEERIDVPWLLYGEQEGDIAKAYGSGLTYAERYFLMKFFNQPTDWLDPDAKTEKEPVNEKTEEEIEMDRIANSFIDKNNIGALEAELDRTRVPVTEIYRNYGIDTLSELRWFQWKSAMDLLATMPTKKKQVQTNVAR